MTSEAVTAALIVGVVVGGLGWLVVSRVPLGWTAVRRPELPLWLSLTIATVSALLVTVAMQMVRIAEDPPAAAVITGVGWSEIAAQAVVGAVAIAAITVVAGFRRR